MLIVHINGEGDAEESAAAETGTGVRDIHGVPAALLDRAVRRVLEDEGVADAELSVSFLDDAGIRAMNREYLERDRVTDVIAFTLNTAVGIAPEAGRAPPPLPYLVGDVYIGLAQASRQAEEMGISLDEELVRLAIHGTLHVLGHDHPEGEGREASELFRRQEALVREAMGGSAGAEASGEAMGGWAARDASDAPT